MPNEKFKKELNYIMENENKIKKELNNLINKYSENPNNDLLYKILEISFKINYIENFKLRYMINEYNILNILNDYFINIHYLLLDMLDIKFIKKHINLLINGILKNDFYCNNVFLNSYFVENYKENKGYKFKI